MKPRREEKNEKNGEKKKIEEEGAAVFRSPLTFTFHAAKLTLRLPANVDYAARCRNLICYMDSMNQFH